MSRSHRSINLSSGSPECERRLGMSFDGLGFAVPSGDADTAASTFPPQPVAQPED